MTSPNIEQIQAFVAAVDEGSFSAAARRLKKAQSAVSTAIINLEIDFDVELFDRSGRSPQLTEIGHSLLEYARTVLSAHQDLTTRASQLGEGVETRLCIAVEQGIRVSVFKDVLFTLGERFPFLEVEILEPGVDDLPGLLRDGRADIGLMLEQEDYPQGFRFRGIGHSQLVPVCGRNHPLAKPQSATHGDLRKFRQVITKSRDGESKAHLRQQKSPTVWFSESPYLIADFLETGIGWSVLPYSVVEDKIASGTLVRFEFAFQTSEILQGIDVVWTEKHALGTAGNWFLNAISQLDSAAWTV